MDTKTVRPLKYGRCSAQEGRSALIGRSSSDISGSRRVSQLCEAKIYD